MAQANEDSASREGRVSLQQLLAYGVGGVIPIALFNSAGQLMGLLGNISLGLSAFWLGTIMIIPRLWDAVSDPIMGHLTDNTRTRWGRRRPFILFGGIAVAVSFVAMWWVPRGPAIEAMFASEATYSWFQLAFILGVLLVFFSACTVFEIPHGALGMEMSKDYHERTRLFSAKSFFGNLFAMATPWLFAIAGWEVFRGPGGDLIDGMRYVSLFIAALLIPLSVWWFLTLEEPGFEVAKKQQKVSFWENMRVALSNRVFLMLVGIIFTLTMAFDIVTLFGTYIEIFYLFGGDNASAGILLGIGGTVWGVTGLLAVFPLNWLSEWLGKNKTLLIAILLMCSAQLAKIYCYNPANPFLILIPKVLLSAGMLMFFTLASSMVGDICDADELATGTRSEGSYYSVFWWILKTGRAFASFATGVLIVLVSFDETQNVAVDDLQGNLNLIKAEARRWDIEPVEIEDRVAAVETQLNSTQSSIDELREHLTQRKQAAAGVGDSDLIEHHQQLSDDLEVFDAATSDLQSNSRELARSPKRMLSEAEEVYQLTIPLKHQASQTLYLMRVIEIGLPLILSIVSIVLTLRYPLTEARCYEIKQQLKQRNAERE